MRECDRKSADDQTSAPNSVQELRSSGLSDVQAGAVSVRLHGKGNVGAKPKGEAVVEILVAIKERRA
jgi:threonyl-tRNA synthetase